MKVGSPAVSDFRHPHAAGEEAASLRSGSGSVEPPAAFRERFVELFEAHFRRVYRLLDRISGEPELAADLAQEAFVRLYRRGSVPHTPGAWLVTVALNLFRNEKASRARRRRLLTLLRGEGAHSDPPPSAGVAAEAEEARQRARAALDRLPERERRLLLLRAEGYGYRDIAIVLELNEASVGTLLARARRAFREACEEASDAP